MITDTQAEAIYDIFEGGWRMDDFMPLEVFHTTSAADTAKLRACTELVRAGLIKRVPVADFDGRSHFRDKQGHYRLALTEDAIQKFHEYAVECEYEFAWRIP